jgi:AcrR family transcriptional regulator
VTSRRTQDERREETRERLLSAAVDVLNSKGYANFRFADVSAVSGVSRGGMTHHYPSKDALVAAVLEYVFERLQQRTKTKLGTVRDSVSALSAIVDSGADFFFAPDFPIYLDLVLAAQHGGSLPRTVRALAQRQSLSIEQTWTSSLVEQGIDEGTARDVVGLLWSLLRGLAVKAIGAVDTGNRERIISFALTIVETYLSSRRSSSPSEFKQDSGLAPASSANKVSGSSGRRSG